MELDRQAIERRDFPIARRGYEPAAVDEHLRVVAQELDDLHSAGTDVSLASTAGSQVQSIVQAAETAAAEIEREAEESARQVREAAARDAARTREDAIEKARSHVAGVAQAAGALLERVASMDGEVSGLVESLRSGASRLAGDLAAVEAGMSELYDAASGHGPRLVPESSNGHEAPSEEQRTAAAPAPVRAATPAAAKSEPQDAPAAGGDLDGARLVALNMALNGESRTATERYLAENFDLPDRAKLIDEVYAAIEG